MLASANQGYVVVTVSVTPYELKSTARTTAAASMKMLTVIPMAYQTLLI